MSNSVAFSVPVNPATGSLNGQVVNLWDAGPANARFGTPPVVPATNGSPPSGSPDQTYTTDSNNDGFWTFTVSTPDEWIISTYDPLDTSNGGSYNTYWLGPYFINPSTNLVGWTAALDQSTHRNLAGTLVTSGSNGVVLPQTTINVVSTAPNNPGAFLSGGYLLIRLSGTWTYVKYTGTSGGNTFTGCSLGSGTLHTNDLVCQAYIAGNYRRLVCYAGEFSIAAGSDSASVLFVSTIGGALLPLGGLGVSFGTGSPVTVGSNVTQTFPVDPVGVYGGYPQLLGTGSINNYASTGTWVEVDL